MDADYLASEGDRTDVAENGRNALYTARHANPDLILLIMIEMDGFAFMGYRQEADVPVIVGTPLSFRPRCQAPS